MKICVLIPTYNDSRTLLQILKAVLAQESVGSVVVVDDGSDDGTASLLDTLPLVDPRLKHFRHAKNLGKGAALRTALAASSGPLVLVQDADLEYDPADYERLVARLVADNASVVYGSRFCPAARRSAGAAWHTLGNRLLTWFANRVTGQRLTDEATGYKLFRREMLERMNLQEDGFAFCPEVTAKAGRLGLRIVEVPISYHPRTRAEGKKIRLWHGLEALWCLVKYTWFDRSLEPGARRRRSAVLKEAADVPDVPASPPPVNPLGCPSY
jgi:glycosyltransferase involved in cell wall biosynthesis